ncbi:hypothetical protein B0T19DRAFT_147391 [Cercophora scortea]|uniref:Uncharacterized protein n=1 Tax=Cercophora scortea TaxID=314031 RepID=A0AAE0IZG4_9PEZI|nr:hypothetical protein B0T19DRAFT_147391 [Cercophora scortea]
MGVQLERARSTPTPFEQQQQQHQPYEYGPWHFRDARFQQPGACDDLDRVDFHGTAATAALLAIPALNSFCDGAIKAQQQQQRLTVEISSPLLPKLSAKQPPKLLLSPPKPPPRTLPPSPPIPAKSLPSPLARLPTWNPGPFPSPLLTFPLASPPASRSSPPPPHPSLKRRRPATDVDGPNTASMSCKKRRLLRTLITSRLSRPFSLPATHILNRECVAAGVADQKRLLRLAAIVAARKLSTQQQPSPPSPGSLLRRAAVINCFRMRMREEAAARGELGPVGVVGVDLPTGLGAHGSVAARFIPAVVATAMPIPPSASGHRGVQLPHAHPHPLSGRAPEPTAGGTTHHVRLPLPPSPRLRPIRSPELRSTRVVELDDDEVEDLDDDNVAFPTSEHESRYEDEPDDVYADFGLIFGGGGAGSGEEDEGEGAECYEDYMDDVDGIPWNARC